MVKAGSWHPLHSALIFGDLDKAKTLLSSSDDMQLKLLNHANDKGWRAIHFASHSRDVASVEWLLSLPKADPNARTCKGETALHLAAARDDEAMCKALLDGGCSANNVTREGKTALHVSSELGHMAVTRLLVVGAGLSPSTPDGMGASAAALAHAGNHKDVLQLLQKSCPGVPLGIASRRGRRRREGASALLLGKHFDGKRQSRDGVALDGDGRHGRRRGRTKQKGLDEAGHRLLKAAREGDVEAMGEILATGEIEVDWVGRSNGWTAVMEAAEHGSLESICYLVDKGADLERTTNKGLTPLQLAVRSGFLGVTEELLRRGARPGVTTKSGRCLRCLADESGHRYLADWLFYMGVADGENGGCACSGNTSGDPPSKGKATTLRQPIALQLEPHEVSRAASSLTKRGSEEATAPAALTQWLNALGLGEYESQLVSQGFDTVEAMGLATEEDLEAMGFKKGHLRRFLAGALSGVKESTVTVYPVPGVSRPDQGETSTQVQQEAKKVAFEEKYGDEDGQYCDAGALGPTRALSLPVPGSSRDAGGSEGLFKELRPEEVEVEGIIGEGSFGVVKRGKWRGMDVAVKELKTFVAATAATATAEGGVGVGETGQKNGAKALGEGRATRSLSDLSEGEEEMRHEATMLAKVCNHACVVQFVGVLLQPVPSVVTRFMENGSVETLLVSSDKPASKKMVLRMAIEAAKGVIHLHREGVVHRDLASRNLLLDDSFHVRISDFGFSRVKRECVSRGYTRSDMGPIRWTSPEAMRKRCYSEASDAFSFGVVMYEMLSRRPPWEGHENLDVAYRVCSGERMEVPASVDTAMSSLMSRCWDHNPRSRPDFASILIALTEFAGNLTADSGEAPVEPPVRDSKMTTDTTARARAAAIAAAAAAATEETAQSKGAAYGHDLKVTDSIVGGAKGAVAGNSATRAPRSARQSGGKSGSWRERRDSGQGSDHGTRNERGLGASDKDHGGRRWGGRLGGRGGAGYSPARPDSAEELSPNGSASYSRSRRGSRGRGRGRGGGGGIKGSLRKIREDRAEEERN